MILYHCIVLCYIRKSRLLKRPERQQQARKGTRSKPACKRAMNTTNDTNNDNNINIYIYIYINNNNM